MGNLRKLSLVLLLATNLSGAISVVRSLLVGFFVEDVAQINFIVSLVRRVASDLDPTLDIQDRALNATGGRARVLAELRGFLQDVRSGHILPDALVIAMDCDCQRRARVAQELDRVVADVNVAGCTVFALPEPHIERWYMAGRAAANNRSPRNASTATATVQERPLQAGSDG